MKIFTLRKTQVILALLLLTSIFGSLAPLVGLNIQILPVIDKIQDENNETIKNFKTFHGLLDISKSADKIYHNISKDNKDLKVWNKKVALLEKSIPPGVIKNLFNEETIYYDQAFQLSHEIGTERYGLIGKLRKIIHKYETLTKSDTAKRIRKLELRRREKDFLLRLDQEHIDKFDDALEEALNFSTPKERKLLLEYSKVFKRIINKSLLKQGYFQDATRISEKINDRLASVIDKQKGSHSMTVHLIDDFKYKLTHIIIVAICFIVASIAYIFRVVQIENTRKEKLIRNVENKLHENLRLQEQLVAQEKLSSLGVLSAGIAHEVRNPLNLISGSAQNINVILTDLIDDSEKGSITISPTVSTEISSLKEMSDIILSSTSRANSIVSNMLSISSNKNRDKEIFDLSLTLQESYNLSYHAMRASTPFDLVSFIKLEPNCEVLGLKSEISRAFINIIDNSLYALREKLQREKKKGSNYRPEISIGLQVQNDTITITIEDNGIGIDKAIIDKVSDPFFTTKPTGQGTGLGMHFVFDCIKEHRGSLKVDSKLNEYTKITVTFNNNLS